MECQHEIKKLVNNKGFFAKVVLDVTQTRQMNLDVEMVKPYARWEATLNFACQYFVQRFYRGDGNLKVVVKMIESHDVDTTELVVFYATVHALCKGFDIDCKITIDELGNIVVPK